MTAEDMKIAENEAPRYAHMSDDQIQYWVDRLTAERDVPLYHLRVSSYEADRSGTALYGYKQELRRRAAQSYAIAAE